jgi:hypothetical protein
MTPAERLHYEKGFKKALEFVGGKIRENLSLREILEAVQMKVDTKKHEIAQLEKGAAS